MSICCLFLPLCLKNKVYLCTFSAFNMFNLLDTQFYLSHKKMLVKILGFEVSFNQLTNKVRRNVKLSKYLPIVKPD